MIQHLGSDRGTFNGGRAKYGVIAANHQDFAGFHHRSGLGFEPVDPEHILGSDAILLAARFDDREHLFRPLCSCTISDPKDPDLLLAIVISVLLLGLSGATTKCAGTEGTRVIALLMAVQGFPVNHTLPG